MDSIDFSRINGFPFDAEILAMLQSAFALFNAYGTVHGDKTIISGCENIGGTVNDGVVYLNGELFKFKGGGVQTEVRIVEDTQDLVFENQVAYPVIKKRYVTFGSGVGAVPWADFKTLYETKNLNANFADVYNNLTLLWNFANTVERGAQKQLQADWNATSGVREILNKPQITSSFLHKGTYPIGDPSGYDDSRTITFPNVGTNNYMVIGTLISNGAEGYDNDLRFVIKNNRTPTSFVILLGDSYGGLPSGVQNLEFDYVLIAK